MCSFAITIESHQQQQQQQRKATKMTLKIVYGTIVLCTVWSSFVLADQSKVINLNEENWHSILDKEWMIEFYAPWCPACKNLAPAWQKLGEWSNDIGIRTAKIDVTTSPALSGRFLVAALPTIFHVVNGEFRQYRGPRDADSLITFIEEQKWKDIEPISAWKHPDSIQMTIMSYFFKLSHYLKEVNNVMLVDYGMPPWLTYVLFAIVTILLGALLGLLLVSIIDLIFPSQSSRQSFAQGQAPSIDEDARDVIEDDDATSGAVAANDDEDDDEEEDEAPSTSEGEKFSGSDESDASNEDENNIKATDTAKKSPKSSPEVRKRKPRKAD